MKKKYLELSKKYHPDFITDGNEFEQEQAQEISSQINKAYKIFNNQDQTIKYILELKNLIEVDEKFELPKDFLMEMMDINESLMEAKMEEDKEALDKVQHSISNFQLSIKEEIEEVLNAETIENITISDLQKVKEYYFKKKYLNRILDNIN